MNAISDEFSNGSNLSTINSYLTANTTSNPLAHCLALQMVDIVERKQFSRELMDLIHDDFLNVQMLLNSKNREVLTHIDRIRNKLLSDIQEVRFKLFSDANTIQHVTASRLDELREELANEISKKENTILTTLKRIRNESEHYLNQAKLNEQKEARERQLRKLQQQQQQQLPKSTALPIIGQTPLKTLNTQSTSANWTSVTSFGMNRSYKTFFIIKE
jgi:hypothetical protein